MSIRPGSSTASSSPIDARTVNLPTVARLAESLGRWFEARGWWSLDARLSPDNQEALRRPGPAGPPRRTSPPRPLARRPPRGPRPHLEAVDAPSCDDRPPRLLRRRRGGRAPVHLRQRPDRGPPPPRDHGRRGRPARLRRRRLARRLLRPGRAVPPGDRGRPPNGDRLFRNRGDGTFEDVTTAGGARRPPRRLRPRGGGRRLRQRRPARPLRHAMAVLRPVPQPGRRHLRGRHGGGRAGGRPGLADLGGVGRPRRRRRPRPLRLPLPGLGRRAPAPLRLLHPAPPSTSIATLGDSTPCRTTSSATTGGGSST